MSAANATTRMRPIIRVFVSSTFSDLKLERNALQQRVFPRLERLCQNDGFQFQAIDLRWGVPTEAGLHHRTMRICFEELRRSQDISPEPNFLILLGNRYGWRPLPEEVSAAEFQSLQVAAAQIKDTGLQQSPVDLLHQWYRLDENSLTPVHILQPRRKPKDDDPDSTDYTTPEAWKPVEQILWQIINHNQAFPAVGLRNRFQSASRSENSIPSIVRFQASATEQEIWSGALSVPNAGRHVRAFFRDIRNRDDFSPIETKDFFDLTGTEEFDDSSKKAQDELQDAINSRLGDAAVLPIPFSRLKWHGGEVVIDAREDQLQQFCDDVERVLKEIIERQIREYWEPTCLPAPNNDLLSDRRAARELEIERDEHLRFGKERGSSDLFVGRDEEDGPLARIRNYLDSDSRFPLVIHGDSGCGKTALLARAFHEIPAEKKPIIRFIGVTPRSSDLRSLLRSLCHDLREQHIIADTMHSPVHQLILAFWKHLEEATAADPVILFLDALDQLSEADNGRQLSWLLTRELPSCAKIVVSCLSDRDEDDPASQPYVAFQRRRLPPETMLHLDALSLDDAKTLLFDRWLHTATRTVTDAQRRNLELRLASDGACRQPLYLKLLFEEAKLWHSWDTPHEIGNSVSALLLQFCQRLSRPETHGEPLVRFVLGYLAAARRGLSETEVLEILFADADYKKALDKASEDNNHTLPVDPPRIPIAIWSRLRSDLAPYLTERAAPGSNVLTLYHRQIAEWVSAQFVENTAWTPHGRLADFFKRQEFFSPSTEYQHTSISTLPLHKEDGYHPNTIRHSVEPNYRMLDELPWHLACARHCETLTGLLNDASAIECYETAQLLDQLVADIQFAIDTLASEGLDTRAQTIERTTYWILRLRFGRDVIYAQLARRHAQDGVGSLKGPLPASVFDPRAVLHLRRVFQGRAISSQEYDTFHALINRAGISDDLLELATFAFAKSSPAHAWQLGSMITSEQQRFSCLVAICQLADSVPANLIIEEAQRTPEGRYNEPPHNRGRLLAIAAPHLLRIGPREFCQTVDQLFHSSSELLPLLHFFRALPVDAENERAEIVDALLHVCSAHTGFYESDLFFKAALELSRQLPVEARLLVLAKAQSETHLPGMPDSRLWRDAISIVITEYAALGEFEQIIKLVGMANYKPLAATGFALVAALTSDDRVATALLFRIPSMIDELSDLSLSRYPVDFTIPWPFDVEEPRPLRVEDSRVHIVRAQLAVLYGELQRRFGAELSANVVLGRLFPHMETTLDLGGLRDRLRSDCAKVLDRLHDTWNEDEPRESRTPEEWRACGLAALMQTSTSLPDWCEVERPSITIPDILSESQEQDSADLSDTEFREQWYGSVREIHDLCERHCDLNVPSDTVELPSMEQSPREAEDEPPIDVAVLRREVEDLSQVKQTKTGRGFHDHDMLEYMIPLLQQLRRVPHGISGQIGTRLLDIMGPKWYARHQSYNYTVVRLASAISVDLGLRAVEQFEKGVRTEREAVISIRVLACQSAEIKEAAGLLGQLRDADRMACALKHVAALLPELDDACISVYIDFARCLARLGQGRYADEVFHAAANAAKRMRADLVEPFGNTVLRTLRFEGAPQSVNQLVPSLLKRMSSKDLPKLLSECTFPNSQLFFWRCHIPAATQTLLRRAFEEWRESQLNLS